MSERYTHRNSESEPPVVTGWYWFKGVIGAELQTEGEFEAVFFNDECIWIQGDQSGFPPWTCVGEWWGPLVPPWESDVEQQVEHERETPMSEWPQFRKKTNA